MSERYEKAVAELQKVTEAYERALLAQSWRTSDGVSERSVTNANIAELRIQKERLEARVARYESMLDGSGSRAFRVESLR